MKTIITAFNIVILMVVSGFSQYCDMPGIPAGTTRYPLQSSGSSTNRIARDAYEGVHITWAGGSSRIESDVYYNFYTYYGWMGETIVNLDEPAGYPTLALTADGCAAIAYDNIITDNVILAIDLVSGFGIFEYFEPLDRTTDGKQLFWPQVALSSNEEIHIIMVEHSKGHGLYHSISYTRSSDGGYSWTRPSEVAEVALFNGRITVSPDGKVAIVYLRPAIDDRFSQITNDVCYFISPDGRDWDFSEPKSITDYDDDDLDIYCPWGIDALFGIDDALNVVWLTGNIDDHGQFIDDATKLWHYSDQSGSIMQIAEMNDPDLECELTAATSQIAFPTISINWSWPSEIMSVTYVGYDDTDVSSEGDCVGDLYMVWKSYYEQYWTEPVNITNSHSPDCQPGDCRSENFPSTAKSMTDSVHLTYIMQKFGDIPDTVYYLPVNVSSGVPVYQGRDMATRFKLCGNYPNPFNAKTTIEFEIFEDTDVRLTIYDITGAEVETLIEGEMEAGLHLVSWDADGFASGVYYCRLSSDSASSVRKMVLLK